MITIVLGRPSPPLKASSTHRQNQELVSIHDADPISSLRVVTINDRRSEPTYAPSLIVTNLGWTNGRKDSRRAPIVVDRDNSCLDQRWGSNSRGVYYR
jgi:hypothetical protein